MLAKAIERPTFNETVIAHKANNTWALSETVARPPIKAHEHVAQCRPEARRRIAHVCVVDSGVNDFVMTVAILVIFVNLMCIVRGVTNDYGNRRLFLSLDACSILL